MFLKILFLISHSFIKYLIKTKKRKDLKQEILNPLFQGAVG